MDESERALLAGVVNEALAAAPDTADAVLAGLGWLEMLAAEGRAAIEIVFTALGTTNASSSALDDVVASAVGVPARADLAVLMPAFGAWSPPGRIEGGELVANGLASARVTTATELLVACEHGTVIASMDAVELAPARGVDPESGMHTVQVRCPAPTPVVPSSWPVAVAGAQRALAHQIAGASRTMLALACAHALEREQFGRPVAQFQAVRHRLADALVAVEALEAAATAADDEAGPNTAALAKAIAGRTAETVSAHCRQVLAGIGFTTDHPFHRYLKRTMLLAGLFGSTDALVVDIGRELLAARTVPTLIEL